MISFGFIGPILKKKHGITEFSWLINLAVNS